MFSTMDSIHQFHQFNLFRYQLNKLHAYKSSFQAWKCVSLGYALLAIVLLFSKWHEVSTDLRLLQGIEQILWQMPLHPNHASSSIDGHAALLLNNSGPIQLGSSNSQDDNKPPPPPPPPTSQAAALQALMTAVGGQDESGSQDASAATGTTAASSTPASDEVHESANSSMLMAHMQTSLSRELSGNQLLKQEVEAFSAEFRSAKSTLGLSSLLVFVYIVSWILMTLAVNDTRISNDVSLRNILLLSVFGAIDMAASFGFVMVRLIMFNVKNNTFATEILASSGLRDAPARLSTDQLTAFTALRLVAMRSCSAYMDIYISVVVALLTILRLYAIIRAIAYYRFLRRFNDLNRNLYHQQQVSALMGSNNIKQQQATEEKHHFAQAALSFDRTMQTHGFIAGGAGSDLNSAPAARQNIWQTDGGGGGPTSFFSPSQHHVIASPRQNTTTTTTTNINNNNNNTSQGYHQQASNVAVDSSLATSLHSMNQQEQQQQQQQHFRFGPPAQMGATSFVSSQPLGSLDPLEHEHQRQTLNRAFMLDVLAQRQAGHSVRSPTAFAQQRQQGSSKQHRSAGSAVGANDEQPAEAAPAKSLFGDDHHDEQHAATDRHITNRRPPLLIPPNEQQQRPLGSGPDMKTNNWTAQATTTTNTTSNTNEAQTMPKRPRRQSSSSSTAPNLLVVNGRAHRLVSTKSLARHDESESGGWGGFESEPVQAHRPRRAHQRGQSAEEQEANRALSPLVGRHLNGSLLDANNNNIQDTKQTFTLLSASQLDRLSRKLLANATVGSLGSRNTTTATRHRLIARYRPLKRPLEAVEQPASRQKALDDENLEGSGASSSSGLATDSDDVATLDERESKQGDRPTEAAAEATFNGRKQRAYNTASKQSALSGMRQHRARSSLVGLRQTEEFNVKPLAATTTSAKSSGRDLLLEKYYYT